MIFAQENGRKIPKEDKIFAIGGRAKKMIAQAGAAAVVNATIGALLDDNGDLIVMSSVVDAMSTLTPREYAEYAPITGAPKYKEAVITELFREYKTDKKLEVCATPGGTGAIRNTISNYSNIGDKVLTSDWYWAPYGTIACEIGRKIDTYELFDADNNFNIKGFESKVSELIEKQEQLVIILNTPAHNPTGYSLSTEDWQAVIDCLNKQSEKGKIILLVDVAYLDFAGDEDEYRFFFKYLDMLNENVLPLIAYSASKTFTLYGMRCGALVCMARTEEIAKEFHKVNEFSSRGSWSNCTRAGQMGISKITQNETLRDKVRMERKEYRNMLIERGKTFESTLLKRGIKPVPFDAGFFACVECDDAEKMANALEKEGIFVVPLAKGIRISVASISAEKCEKTANAIADYLGK